MSEILISDLHRENLATHFVLPLLKLNKLSFIASNFVNCCLTEDGATLVVQVMDLNFLSQKVFHHPQYRGTRQRGAEEGYFLLFQMLRKWRRDVQLFREGQFSRMSEAAKDTIVRFSDLPYHEKEDRGERMLTDGRLLALEKHPLLKQFWERYFSSDKKTAPYGREGTVIELDEERELLDPPGSTSYIDLDTLRK